jgi:tetratricopeptide (TPR) repeat protein
VGRRHDDSSSDPVTSHRESPTTETTSQPRGSGAFVGRERELRDLEAGLEDAFSGRGRLFLISGEQGIGKSRLADELATLARKRGASVLWGRSWEAGGAPAYWPWVQSLRSYVRDCNQDTLVSQLGDGAADVAQMLPELRQIITDLPASQSLESEGARFRMFDSLSKFLRTASEARPLIFVLDDLHAADTSSLILLRFVVGELAEARILIIGAFRDEEQNHDHPIAESLAELARENVTRSITLRGLSQSEVARFIEATMEVDPPNDLVDSVHSETEGNPLFVGEVIGFLAAEGRWGASLGSAWAEVAIPPRVRDIIGRRLDHLSEDCSRILRIASILGREFDLDALERASGLSPAELLALLDEADAARVVTEVPGVLGRLRFSHALVRDVLYDELTSLQRVQLHREVGEMLETLYGDDTEPHLAELAHHFSQAARGGDGADKAVTYARTAGDRAVALLAYEEAVRLYRLALQALELRGTTYDKDPCELLLKLGDAETRTGDTDAAKQSFLRVADIAKNRKMPEQRAQAALGYGGRFAWSRASNDPLLVPLLEDALLALDEGDGTLRVQLLARLSGALRDQSEREPRATLSRQAVEMARRLGDPATLAYALEARWEAIWWLENIDERLDIATELIRLSQDIRDKERTFEAHQHRFIAFIELGDMLAADAELAACARLADELRQPAQLWSVVSARAVHALFSGRLDEADELIQQAIHIGGKAPEETAIAFRGQRFLLLLDRGGLSELERSVNSSVEEHPARPMFRCLQARFFCELGRTVEARMSFERLATDDFAGVPLDNEWLFSMTLLPEVSAFLNDARRAATLYALLLPHAERNAVDFPEGSTGSVSRGLGILATTMSLLDEAEQHFEVALEMNARMGARPWVARTQHDYARMLFARDRPGDREKAILLLSDSSATCQALGMVSLGGNVASLLETNDIRASQKGLSGSSPHQILEPSVFRREGEYWSLAYERDAFRLKDSKGLRYIAHLLADPGREFFVLDLLRQADGFDADGTTLVGASQAELGLEVSDLNDGGSILDSQAKAAYRRRLGELEEELDEAQESGDAERAARAKGEQDFLARELAGALGLGGRDRKAASESERARINITKTIRSALSRIRKNSPAMGLHLERTIRTGTFCSYVPDPRFPIDWRF